MKSKKKIQKLLIASLIYYLKNKHYSTNRSLMWEDTHVLEWEMQDPQSRVWIAQESTYSPLTAVIPVQPPDQHGLYCMTILIKCAK